jgi:hypothetical protein
MASRGASDVRLIVLSSPTEVREKMGSVLHLYRPLTRTAHDVHTVVMDAFRLPSSGCNRRSHRSNGLRDPRTPMADGRGGWPLLDAGGSARP